RSRISARPLGGALLPRPGRPVDRGDLDRRRRRLRPRDPVPSERHALRRGLEQSAALVLLPLPPPDRSLPVDPAPAGRHPGAARAAPREGETPTRAAALVRGP